LRQPRCGGADGAGGAGDEERTGTAAAEERRVGRRGGVSSVVVVVVVVVEVVVARWLVVKRAGKGGGVGGQTGREGACRQEVVDQKYQVSKYRSSQVSGIHVSKCRVSLSAGDWASSSSRQPACSEAIFLSGSSSSIHWVSSFTVVAG